MEEWTENARTCLQTLFNRYKNKNTCEDIHVGRNRVVFLFPHYVVKLPRNADGYADNDWEGSVSHLENSNPKEDIQYARTRLVYYHGIPILFMERVEQVCCGEALPEWVKSVDCCQVGWTQKGEIVAYDYGFR